MSVVIKHKASGMYAEYIPKNFTRVYLCEYGLEALQFSNYQTAENALKMMGLNLDDWVIEEYKDE